jgi:hypothetical protein
MGFAPALTITIIPQPATSPKAARFSAAVLCGRERHEVTNPGSWSRYDGGQTKEQMFAELMASADPGPRTRCDPECVNPRTPGAWASADPGPRTHCDYFPRRRSHVSTPWRQPIPALGPTATAAKVFWAH